MHQINRQVLMTIVASGALVMALVIAFLAAGRVQVFAADARLVDPPFLLGSVAAGTSSPVRLLLPLLSAPDETHQVIASQKAVLTCSNLIRNGGFEAPASGSPWTGVANQSARRTAETWINATQPHSGTQSAHLGSARLGNYWSELIQTITLPKKTTSVTLMYWRYLDMPAVSGARAADSFTVGLETEQGIQIVTPQKIDATSAGRGTWVRSTMSLSNAEVYSGQRIWVTFKGRTGARYPATLYIDDVQLSVCAVR